MKFLLFGTGDYYERYKKWFDKDDVVALLDNSPAKQGTIIDGIKVLAPENGVNLEYDAIVILSFYVKAMRSQLESLGVSGNRIYHFYDLHRLIYRKEIKKPIEYYGASKEELLSDKERKILLLSQDMTLGGPAIALFHVARVLADHGYAVVFASMIDGPLREQLTEEGIPVIVDANLQIETMNEAEWVNAYLLVWCNTINFHVFLSQRNIDIPVIWWLHDSAFFYDGIDREVLGGMDFKNMRVYSVGPVPRNAMHGFVNDITINDLLYGVSDTVHGFSMPDKRKCDRFCFVTIGYIEERKGQDILLQAIKMLPAKLRKKGKFYLVGQDSSVMAKTIKAEIADMPEIIMTGPVDRDIISGILDSADAMIVPSREDPMPTVAAEAMMHGVPCIVSDATGTAGYIHDGVDGFIFETGNAAELAGKISWCMENDALVHDMGKNARKIYEQYFSIEVLEGNLLDIVEGM